MKTQSHIPLAIAAIVLSSILLGCATTTGKWRQFDTSKIKPIVKGKTTADQIQAMYGPPSSTSQIVVRGSSHGERWLYFYDVAFVQVISYPGVAAGRYLPTAVNFRQVFPNTITTKHHKIATVIFDKDKIVVNYWVKDAPK